MCVCVCAMKKRRQKAKPRAASNSGKYDAADATDATDVSTESEELKGKELLNGDLESEEKDKDVGSDKRNTSFTNVTISLESNDDTSSSSSSSSSSACCSSSSSSSVTKSISPQKTTTSSSSSYLLIELKLICMDLSCVKYNELTHKYLCIDANGSLLSHIEKFILSKMGIAESLFEVRASSYSHQNTILQTIKVNRLI